MKLCYNCSYEFSLDYKPGRRDECPNCSYDVHVCKNCEFYDPTYYNECRENNAERVVEKEKSNFCSYFSFKKSNISEQKDVKKESRDAFNKLFDD